MFEYFDLSEFDEGSKPYWELREVLLVIHSCT